MEHMVFGALLMVALKAVFFDGPRRSVARCAVIGVLLPIARPEGVFVVVALTGVLLVTSCRGAGWALATGSFVSIATFALWSRTQGLPLLPAGLLMKSGLSWPPASLDALARFVGFELVSNAAACPELIVLLIPTMAFVTIRSQSWTGHAAVTTGIACLATVVMHLQFAAVGWAMRYESYLVAWATLVGALALAELKATLRIGGAVPHGLLARGALSVSALLLVAPLLVRSAQGLRVGPVAAAEIHALNYQIGRFVTRYYSGHPILLHDIGLVTYLADIRVIDYDGLGTTSMTRRRLEHGAVTLDEATTMARAGGAPVAIFSDLWLSRENHTAPETWQRVARFRLPTGGYAIPTEFSLYALSQHGRSVLEEQVRNFASTISPRLEGRLAVEIVDAGGRYERLHFGQ
jgi:hypothetical protein